MNKTFVELELERIQLTTDMELLESKAKVSSGDALERIHLHLYDMQGEYNEVVRFLKEALGA